MKALSLMDMKDEGVKFNEHENEGVKFNENEKWRL